MRLWVSAAVGLSVCAAASSVWAQDAGTDNPGAALPDEAVVRNTTAPAPAASADTTDNDHQTPGAGLAAPGTGGDEEEDHTDDDDDDSSPVRLHGYLEGYYAYNLNQPSNGVNAFRYYDSRHDQFALGNAVFDFGWHLGRVSGHIALQTGAITESYVTPARALEIDLLWRLFQEATVSWTTGLGRGLRFDGGLFVIPFGPEEMAVYKNWNWSSSNLFAIVPYQQVGVRAVYPLSDRWSVAAGVYNGWDQITRDNNPQKSVSAEVTYESDRVFFDAEYYGGVERNDGAPEGPYWRHTLDAYVQVQLSRRFEVMAHFNGGVEPNRFGTSAWAGAAIYGRVRLARWLRFATRLDTVYESVPTLTRPDGSSQTAESLFFDGAHQVSSATFTLDARPHPHVSLRLELRHDAADENFYFRDNVPTDMMSGASMPNARTQTTLLGGFTSWF